MRRAARSDGAALGPAGHASLASRVAHRGGHAAAAAQEYTWRTASNEVAMQSAAVNALKEKADANRKAIEERCGDGSSHNPDAVRRSALM